MQSPRRRGIGLAAGDALPAIYFQRDCMAAGGLMSYSTDLAAAYRQAGIYAGKILSGARPAELPVVQSDKFELLINVKVAKSLGIKIYIALARRLAATAISCLPSRQSAIFHEPPYAPR